MGGRFTAECCFFPCLPGTIHFDHTPSPSRRERCFWLELKMFWSCWWTPWLPGRKDKTNNIIDFNWQDVDWVQISLHIHRCGAHLWAGGVSGASGSLAPGSTLAAQLLGAMLSDSFEQQVVDSREVIVAAVLQRLGTEDSNVFTLTSLVPNAVCGRTLHFDRFLKV